MRVLKVASLAALAAWAGLILARGRFWVARADELREPPPRLTELANAPRVQAVVPARNEQSVLAHTLPALLEQRGVRNFAVTLVDDRSDDGTAEVAREVARTHAAGSRLSVVRAGAHPAGWAGKVWALSEGVKAVLEERGAPDYWLFTDADILHHAESVATLANAAVERRRDLVSLMVELHCGTAPERLLIPAFVFFFRKLFPFTWVNDDRQTTAAAAGGCLLISHRALERIGGLQRIATAVIDDCSLASAVKRSGGTLWLGLSSKVKSIRRYETFEEIWRMVARSAYAQLDYSKANVAASVAGMTLLYLVPPVATVAGALRRDGITALAGAASWTVMSLAYAPTLRLYKQFPPNALALPVAAALYTAMTIDSARRHETGLGNPWKGRVLNGKATSPPSAPTVPEPAGRQR